MMTPLLPTFEYQNDQVNAVFEGKVIAKGQEFSKVAQVATEYLESLSQSRAHNARELARKTATHISTPNGSKGQILNRVAGLWGDKITVRFENGQIRSFDTMAGDERLSYSHEEAEVPKNVREALQHQLDEDYDHGINGLTARLHVLDEIKREASVHASSERSPLELQEYHRLVLAAEHESQEVKDALEYLQSSDVEAYMPPAFAAVEQADLGRAKGDTWLDVVAKEIIAESENQDFDKLLSEGPTVLVGNLGDAAIHNTATVREAAENFIISRTAGFQGDKVAAYREEFIARAEQARRQELRYRTVAQKEEMQREASVSDKIGDEALFI